MHLSFWGRRPCDKPLQAKSKHPFYLRASQGPRYKPISDLSRLFFLFRFIPTYTASTPLHDCVVCTPYGVRTCHIVWQDVEDQRRLHMQRNTLDSFRPNQAPVALIAEPNDDQSLGHPRPHQSSDIRPDTTNASQTPSRAAHWMNSPWHFLFHDSHVLLSQLLCHSYFWIRRYDGVCICSHVIALSQWKEGEKIAESGAGLPHFWMFTSFVGMCVCTHNIWRARER